VELTGGLNPAPPRELTPRQLGLSEAANPDLPATPDRPGHEDRRKHCDYCGGTRSELVPGPDGADGYRVCADERGCLARHEHRYPPRPDLVPDAVLSAVGDADEAQAARAAQQPAPEPQSQPEPEGWRTPEGWVSTANGSWTARGDWLPPLPAYQAYSHTIAGGAHTGHLLSGQPRPHYYAGANYLPMAVYGAEGHEESTSGQQGSQPGIPAPEARRGAYEAARGATEEGADVPLQQPAEPEAAPQRPARQRPPRDRYGRRRVLKYQGRR
jgi:hypothetical protein